MRKIKLANTVKFALISNIDFKKVNKNRWYLTRNKNGTFYASMFICKNGIISTKLMHRFILNLSFKNPSIDHKDRNGLNNQRNNLRVCTKSQNQQNRLKQAKKTSSKYKGVSWCKVNKKWRTQIIVLGKRISLKYHRNEIKAAKAYDKAAIKYFKSFSRTNFK